MKKIGMIMVCLLPFYGLQARSGAKPDTSHYGLGLRLGGQAGVTFRMTRNEDVAWEGMLLFGQRSLILTGLYEFQREAFSHAQWKWYYGGGAHLGFYKSTIGFRYNDGWVNRSGPSLGIDGIFALEYNIREIPFSVSIDIKPYLEFTYPGLYFESALNIRYVF